jgi:MFS family permease
MMSRMSSRKAAGTARGSRIAVSVLCLVQFVDVLGVTSAVTAIPAMLRGVGADSSLAGPLATAYAMFFGGLLVLGARMGQKYGHRRVLVLGLLLFVTASTIGALALSAWQLLLARSLQGAASAVSVPAALSLLLAEAPGREDRAPALALWSAAGAAAGATGFLVGGVATEVLDWRAVFWVNIPVGLALIAGVVALVRASPSRDPRTSLDTMGAVLLIATVMTVVAGAALLEHEASRALGAVCVAAAIPLALALGTWQRRAATPIVPLSALRQPRLVIGTVGSFVNTAATSSPGVLLTLDLQERQGLGAFAAGMVLLPLSLSVILGSTAASRLLRRDGRRRTIGPGLGLIGTGNAVVAMTLGSVVGALVGVAICGTGLGLSSVGCTDLGTDVPEEHSSTATGLLNTGAQVGTAVGVALLVLVAARGEYGDLSATSVALMLAALGALLSAVVLPRWDRVTVDQGSVRSGGAG